MFLTTSAWRVIRRYYEQRRARVDKRKKRKRKVKVKAFCPNCKLTFDVEIEVEGGDVICSGCGDSLPYLVKLDDSSADNEESYF
jgi:transcription elongation factor Elf1